jgi:UDP-GlcNAc:undecaprenyl-phosphate/decaprenyl-phosphate GlcNAc-1-phosphate transferase
VPYLGGLAILGGFLAGILVTETWREFLGLSAAVGVLAIVGLFDDSKSVPALLRLSLHIVAAAVAMASGLLAAPTDVEAINAAITLLWLVGITNAFNLLDNMNGLCSGVAAIAALFFVIMAVMEDQAPVAALAGVTAGAALGFLPHNFPRARIFMGDAGSVPLGFLLAVIALKVRFPVPQPWSFAAPVCVLGIAVVDTTVVVVDRLRSGRPIAIGGTDHLSHRLVGRGMSPSGAVGALFFLSACLGVIGLVGGQGILHPVVMVLTWVALGSAGSLLVFGRKARSTEIHLDDATNIEKAARSEVQADTVTPRQTKRM